MPVARALKNSTEQQQKAISPWQLAASRGRDSTDSPTVASSNWSPSKGSSTGISSGSSTASSSSRRKRAAGEWLALHLCSKLLYSLSLPALLQEKTKVSLEVAPHVQILYHHPECHLQPALCCRCQCQSYRSWWLSCRISLSCAPGRCWRAHPLTFPRTHGAWSQPRCLRCGSCRDSPWSGARGGYPCGCPRCSHFHGSSCHTGPGPCPECHWCRTPGSASSLRKKEGKNQWEL